MTPRPVALTVHVAGIPEILRAERRWVVWRNEWDGHRWTKRPYQPRGVLARSDDPVTWCPFEDALAAYRAGNFDGVGFVLGDGWAGIDLDKCVTDYDPKTGGRGNKAVFSEYSLTRVVATEAVGPYLHALDGSGMYWEVSPSGTGYKAIGRAARIGGEIKFTTDPPTVTTWTGAHYFAITGHYQSCSSNPTIDIADLIDRWFPPAPALTLSSAREGYRLAAECTDDQLLAQVIGGDDEARGDEFLALWRGDTRAYGGDHSRADLALCCHLAFWTNYDAERVDRMFRQSG